MRSGLNRELQGRFLSFSLTTLHDLNEPLVQRERPRRSVTAAQPVPLPGSTPKSFAGRSGAKRRVDAGLGRGWLLTVVAEAAEWEGRLC